MAMLFDETGKRVAAIPTEAIYNILRESQDAVGDNRCGDLGWYALKGLLLTVCERVEGQVATANWEAELVAQGYTIERDGDLVSYRAPQREAAREEATA